MCNNQHQVASLSKEWRFSQDKTQLKREFSFADFQKAHRFVDSVADSIKDYIPIIHWNNTIVEICLIAKQHGVFVEEEFLFAESLDNISINLL